MLFRFYKVHRNIVEYQSFFDAVLKCQTDTIDYIENQPYAPIGDNFWYVWQALDENYAQLFDD